MCTVCGCGSGELRINGKAVPMRTPAAKPRADDGTRGWRKLAPAGTGTAPMEPASMGTAARPPHPADARPPHHPTAAVASGPTHLHFGHGPAHAHAPGLSQAEMVRIEQDILGKNDAYAAANRAHLAALGVFALNLVSSPGSGKTTLLVETIRRLAGRMPVAVIEGDQQTEFDAERIRATGAPALQINTGKGCHLDAHMVGRALRELPLPGRGLLLIENVGNLVCPAAFDLGEAHKVVILSVTEGEDKPLKYPDMFAAADLMLLSKVDLLPHLAFDAERAVEYALRVNPRLRVIRCSATSGAGFDEWLAWIEAGVAGATGG